MFVLPKYLFLALRRLISGGRYAVAKKDDVRAAISSQLASRVSSREVLCRAGCGAQGLLLVICPDPAPSLGLLNLEKST